MKQLPFQKKIPYIKGREMGRELQGGELNPRQQGKKVWITKMPLIQLPSRAMILYLNSYKCV